MTDSLAAQRWARMHEATQCPTDESLALVLNQDTERITLAKECDVLPLPWLLDLLPACGVNPGWIMTGRGGAFIADPFQPLRYAALLHSDEIQTGPQELIARYLLEYPPFFQTDPQFNKAVGRALTATDTADMDALALCLGLSKEEAKDARRRQRLPLLWLIRLMRRGFSPHWISEGRGPRGLAQAAG